MTDSLRSSNRDQLDETAAQSPEDQAAIDLVLELAEAERAGDHIPLTIEIGPFAAFVLVSQLQLAWRHPGNAGTDTGLMCEQIARQVQAAFAPELRELLERGWDTVQGRER
jgi:hypothetical protein